MHFLQRLPPPLRKHKVIQFLCGIGVIQNPIKATFNETAKVFLDLNDPEPRNVFLKGVFDPDFFFVARTMLRVKGTFFDLGANAGLCSFGLLSHRPNIRCHLFEANAGLVKLLKQSSTLYPDAFPQLNHACVSDKSGHTNFHIETAQSGQSHVATDFECGLTVPNLILDEYCKTHRIDSVDFAKIDLEGHELPALKGWQSCLSEHKVKAIYIEVIPENQARYGRPANASLSYLESLGYSLYLCKKEDFGSFGNSPIEISLRQGSLTLSRFRAEEYPEDFATDALALAPT